MPTRARIRAERKKKQGRIWGIVAGVLLALIPSLLPRTGTTIIAALLVVFAVLIPAARNGYIYAARWYVVMLLSVFHAVVLIAVGVYIWPRISVSPKRVSFPSETERQFDFTVTNQSDEDYYTIHVPIDVDYQPNDDFGLYLWPLNEDKRPNSQSLENPNQYSYCYKLGSNRPFVFANIDHLEPHQTQRFTLTYKGRPFEAIVGSPLKSSIPTSYYKGVDSAGRMTETGMMSTPKGFGTCFMNLGPKTRKQ